MSRIGFTGTRVGMSGFQEIVLRDFLINEADELHHGDCIGADAEADAIARQLNIPIIIHPPIDPRKRANCYQPGDRIWAEQDYLTRNRDIVDNTDELIAAPRDHEHEELHSGTWSTIRYAQRRGKKVTILVR